jgi:hypothetical protein
MTFAQSLSSALSSTLSSNADPIEQHEPETAEAKTDPFPPAASEPSFALVDLASHKTMEEALPFSVEWNGATYRIFVPRSVLEDLDRATSYRHDEQLVASFKRNKDLILERTLHVLEKGRGRWGTVLLKTYDFPELFQ